MQVFAEILLFVSVAMNAALMTFIAGVLRKVMNDMDEPTFKHFLDSLVRHSKKSPFMITIFNVPLIGAIPYIYFYGVRNRWIIAGLALWLAVGVVAKTIKFPLYKRVAALNERDVVQLGKERKRLNNGNLLQAILNSVAVAVMLFAFVG